MIKILYQDAKVCIVQTTAGNMCHSTYGGFNLGLHVGDDSKSVLANRAKLLEDLAALSSGAVHELLWLTQTHSRDVVEGQIRLAPACADALISTKQGVGLAIMTADCVPIALFGQTQEGGAIACVHAGWQGLLKGIIHQTVSQLPKARYQAHIGACIGVDNYEVDKVLADSIVDECLSLKLTHLDKAALSNAIIRTHPNVNKVYLDVAMLARVQLSALGIEVINEAVECSYQGAKTGEYYSHRHATHQGAAHTGRMAMIVVQFD